MSSKRPPAPPAEISNMSTRLHGDALPPAPSREVVAKATVIKGNEEGTEILVKRGITQIGRAADNDLPLTDLSSSRKHAQLVWDDDCLNVVDLGSGNGTKLNGRRVTKTTLRNGDVIEIGGTHIKIELFAPPEEGEPTTMRPPPIEPPKRPGSPSPVAEHMTVGLPGVGPELKPANKLQLPMQGGVLPPTSTGATDLPGPFGRKPGAPPNPPAAPNRSQAIQAGRSGPSAAFPFSPPKSAPTAPPVAPPPVPAAPAPAPMAAPVPVAPQVPPPVVPAPVAPAPFVAPAPAPMAPAPVVAAPSAPQPVVVPSLGAASGGRAKLVALTERLGNKGFYAGIAVTAVSLLGSGVLFALSPGKESGAAQFRAGISAYQNQKVGEAESAFSAALALSPDFTEARDYLWLARTERSAQERLATAKETLTGAMSLEQTLSGLSLARSIPATSVFASEADSLAREAERAWFSQAEGALRQHITAQQYQEAALLLARTEKAVGPLPSSLNGAIQDLQRATSADDWRRLLPTGAAPSEAPVIAAAPPTEPQPAAPEVPPTEPQPAAVPSETPPVAAPSEAPKEPTPTPPVKEPAPPANPPPAQPPPAKEPATPGAKTPAQYIESAKSLYKSRKFTAAANEAKKAKNKDGDKLAKDIESFGTKYEDIKRKYDAGTRAALYAEIPSIKSLDARIVKGGAFQSEISTMYGTCADDFADKKYTEGTKSKPPNYNTVGQAYSAAKTAMTYNKSASKSPKIISSVEKMSSGLLEAGAKAEKKGKDSDALTAYQNVMTLVPGSGDAQTAKKSKEALEKKSGLKKGD